MGIKIEKTFQAKEPIEAVWAFLSDPAKVATCVPGAQITEKIDESHYKGSISMKVGPAVMDFKGQLEVLKLDPEAHVLEMMGKGQDVRGKGSASMKMTGSLRALPDGGTEVVSVSEVNIVGILAQMGGRIINEVSNIMFQKFTKNFQEKLEQEKQGQGSEEKQPGAAPKPINAVSVAFSALKAAVTRHKTTETQPAPEEKSEQKTQ